MIERKATNITRHEGHVSRPIRETLLGQKGCTIWLTGLPSSGKSTTAFTLEHELVQQGHIAYVLDGDNIRFGLNRNLGFSPEDRAENIRRIGEVALLYADTGIIAITSFISPYREDRDLVRERQRTRSDPVELPALDRMNAAQLSANHQVPHFDQPSPAAPVAATGLLARGWAPESNANPVLPLRKVCRDLHRVAFPYLLASDPERWSMITTQEGMVILDEIPAGPR